MTSFALGSYLQRIGFAGTPRPDLATLQQLHRLHPAVIPFENLDTLLGRRVRIDIESIQAKLIQQRRGGYCYEQNTLLQAALEAIGFDLIPLAARVVWNRDRGFDNPRTHMILLVDLDSAKYICDVGFGGANLTTPLPFAPGSIVTTPHAPFRLEAGNSLFAVGVCIQQQWRTAYEFDLQIQRPVDYEAMNHYVQTYPGSHFGEQLMVAISDATGRSALQNNLLGRYENGKCVAREYFDSAAELRDALTGKFRLDLPSGVEIDALLERVAATPRQ